MSEIDVESSGQTTFERLEKSARAEFVECFRTPSGDVVKLENEDYVSYVQMMDEAVRDVIGAAQEQIVSIEERSSQQVEAITGELPRTLMSEFTYDGSSDAETVKDRWVDLFRNRENFLIPSGEYLVSVDKIVEEIEQGKAKIVQRTEGYGKDRSAVPGVRLSTIRTVGILANVTYRDASPSLESNEHTSTWLFVFSGPSAKYREDIAVAAECAGRYALRVKKWTEGGFERVEATYIPASEETGAKGKVGKEGKKNRK